jgi:hypothetical protein
MSSVGGARSRGKANFWGVVGHIGSIIGEERDNSVRENDLEEIP